MLCYYVWSPRLHTPKLISVWPGKGGQMGGLYVVGAGITITEAQYTKPKGSYEGVILNQIPQGLLNLSNPAVVYVSGSGGNPFGHALFMISPSIGYVHSVEPGTHQARFIPHDEFERFMKEMGKTSWTMQPVELSNPQGAATFIQKCLTVGYTWYPHHNCVSLCIEICQAGGSDVVPTSVLPTKATKDKGNIPKPAFSHPYDSITNDML